MDEWIRVFVTIHRLKIVASIFFLGGWTETLSRILIEKKNYTKDKQKICTGEKDKTKKRPLARQYLRKFRTPGA